MKWTPDAVLAAIRAEADRRKTTRLKFDHLRMSDHPMPHWRTIKDLFGGFNAAKQLVGLEATPAGGQGRYPRP